MKPTYYQCFSLDSEMMGNLLFYFNFFSVSSKFHCLFSKKRRKINILLTIIEGARKIYDETILPWPFFPQLLLLSTMKEFRSSNYFWPGYLGALYDSLCVGWWVWAPCIYRSPDITHLAPTSVESALPHNKNFKYELFLTAVYGVSKLPKPHHTTCNQRASSKISYPSSIQKLKITHTEACPISAPNRCLKCLSHKCKDKLKNQCSLTLTLIPVPPQDQSGGTQKKLDFPAVPGLGDWAPPYSTPPLSSR